jgi:lysophospholipase L1-like esterase
MIKLKYRADQADRAYGRFSTQLFTDLRSAIEYARSHVALADVVSFEIAETGASVAVGRRLLAGPNISGLPWTTQPDEWGKTWLPARFQARQRQVLVHAWGDSISEGAGSTDPVNLGYFGLLGDFLRAEYGDGGSGFLPQGNATTTTGTWTAGNGFGGAAATATAAASKSWTAIRGTTMRIFFDNVGPAGSFRYRIDGESFTTITPPVGFSVEPGVVERTGLADVPHTIDIEWVSGSVTLHGIQGVYPTGIITSRCAQGGKAASDYSLNEISRLTIGTTNGSATITSTAPGAFTSSLIGKFISGPNIQNGTTITATASATSATMSQNATGTGSVTAIVSYGSSDNPGVPGLTTDPFLSMGLGRADLVIIALGVNDGADLPKSSNSVRNGLGHIVKAYTGGSTFAYSPDFVFVIEHQGDWFDQEGEWPEHTTEIAAYAASIGAAVVDIWGMGRRSHQYWQDLGLFADTIHPNDAGHVAYARPLIDLLVA